MVQLWTWRSSSGPGRDRLLRWRLASGPVFAVAVLLLGGCSSGPAASTGPRLVTPRALGGSGGVGPRVVGAPISAPDGGAGSQVVVSADRVVTVNRVTARPGAMPSSLVIDVTLAIRSTARVAIANRAEFFQLMASGGDAFGPRNGGTDAFYDPIDAGTSRTGSIQFELPQAAASGLRLLYRPDVGEALIIPLSV